MKEFPAVTFPGKTRDELSVDRQGRTTFDWSAAPWGRKVTVQMRRPGTPPKRRGYAARARQRRKQRVAMREMVRMENCYQRAEGLREVTEALEQLVAEGRIIKHPDGTYQAKPPTLAEQLAERRRGARAAWSADA